MRDPAKQRAAKQRWYDDNKHVYLERNARKRQERIAFVHEMKDRTPCADCGQNFPYYVMDFDHRDGDAKEALVSTLVNSGGMARLLAEIEKCDIVCANCHRERTFARRQAVLSGMV